MYTVKKDLELLKQIARRQEMVENSLFETPVHGILPTDPDVDKARDAIKRLIGKYVFKSFKVNDGQITWKHLTFFVPESVEKGTKRTLGVNIHIVTMYAKQKIKYISFDIKKESRSASESFVHKLI